jgi:hypothetical protein
MLYLYGIKSLAVEKTGLPFRKENRNSIKTAEQIPLPLEGKQILLSEIIFVVKCCVSPGRAILF